MPTKILLFLFIAAFIFYLVKGVPKGLRKGSTYKTNRAVQTRYWIFLVVFIAFLVLVMKML
jgi:hypothetical protein